MANRKKLHDVLRRIKDILTEEGLAGAVTVVGPDEEHPGRCIASKFQHIDAPFSSTTFFKPEGGKGMGIMLKISLGKKEGLEDFETTVDMFRCFELASGHQYNLFKNLDYTILKNTLETISKIDSEQEDFKNNKN